MSFNWAKIEIDSDDTIPITKLLKKIYQNFNLNRRYIKGNIRVTIKMYKSNDNRGRPSYQNNPALINIGSNIHNSINANLVPDTFLNNDDIIFKILVEINFIFDLLFF
jgi:hypothetical protein